MAGIIPGRYTAVVDGPFVVFLVGMRINRLLAFSKWVPVARAMGPMLKELYANKELGFLHGETMVSWRGVTLIQYWRSKQHLHEYAQAPDSVHMPAWAAFNRSVGNDGSVGIWHESYEIGGDDYVSVYRNMPRYGLAAAGEHMRAIGPLGEARSYMRGAADGVIKP